LRYILTYSPIPFLYHIPNPDL